MPKNYKHNTQFDGKGNNTGEACERPARFSRIADTYYNEFVDLIMNAVKIDNLDYRREYFVKKNLFETAYVGYNSTLDDFFITVPAKGRKQVGALWRNGEFKNYDNVSIGTHDYNYDKDVAGDVWRILTANPSITPLFTVARDYAELLAECDIGIRQNICAVRTPAFWVTDDADFRLSVNQAAQQQQDGSACIIVSSAMSNSLKPMTNETPYIADKLNEIKKELRDEFLTRIGILTANTNKRERVQAAEVDAKVGETVDLIYSVIDYWNKQVESFGLDYKMTFNGVTETYYAPEEDDGEDDEDENKEKENDL